MTGENDIESYETTSSEVTRRNVMQIEGSNIESEKEFQKTDSEKSENEEEPEIGELLNRPFTFLPQVISIPTHSNDTSNDT